MSENAPALPRADDIRLIVSDVDGTLLDSHHKVHPRTLRAVRALRKTHPDLPFVICSGKQYNSCAHLRGPDILDLPIDMPSLHCHGCIAYGKGGKLISQVGLKASVIRIVTDAFPNVAVFLFDDEEVRLLQDDGERDWMAMARAYDSNVTDHRGIAAKAELLRRVESGEVPVVKMTLAAEAERAGAIMRQLDHVLERGSEPLECTATRAIPTIVEICPKGVNKATAVTTLCDSLDIPLANVLAFGDGENDAEMLAAVGFGVAMANAMPRTANAARYRTLSNDEGGVGSFLEKIYGLSP